MLSLQTNTKDNYIGPNFLKGMEINKNIRRYKYKEIVNETAKISRMLNELVYLFLLFMELQSTCQSGTLNYTEEGYVYNVSRSPLIDNKNVYSNYGRENSNYTEGSYEYNVSGKPLTDIHETMYFGILGNLIVTIIYTTFFIIRVPKIQVKTIKSTILSLILLSLMSPVIRTLTEDVSSNMIYFFTVFFSMLGLLARTKKHTEVENEIKNSSVAIGIQFITACIIASRFNTYKDIFMFLNVSLFFILPFQAIKETNKYRIILHFSVLFGLLRSSKIGFLLHVLLFIVCTVLFPILIVHVQKYKRVINGPWDEEVPDVEIKRGILI